MHVLQLAMILLRLHPLFRLDNRHVEYTHPPTRLSAADMTAERLREHLVAETNADEGLACVVYVAHASFERFYPVALVVHGKARAGADIGIACVRCGRNIA